MKSYNNIALPITFWYEYFEVPFIFARFNRDILNCKCDRDFEEVVARPSISWTVPQKLAHRKRVYAKLKVLNPDFEVPWHLRHKLEKTAKAVCA